MKKTTGSAYRYGVEVRISDRWMTVQGAESVTFEHAGRLVRAYERQGGVVRVLPR